jgi:hypothetical protein
MALLGGKIASSVNPPGGVLRTTARPSRSMRRRIDPDVAHVPPSGQETEPGTPATQSQAVCQLSVMLGSLVVVTGLLR